MTVAVCAEAADANNRHARMTILKRRAPLARLVIRASEIIQPSSMLPTELPPLRNPACAFREHCVPFLVVARHRASAAGAALGTGGLQFLHGPYRAAASARGISILDFESELQEAR